MCSDCAMPTPGEPMFSTGPVHFQTLPLKNVLIDGHDHSLCCNPRVQPWLIYPVGKGTCVNPPHILARPSTLVLHLLQRTASGWKTKEQSCDWSPFPSSASCNAVRFASNCGTAEKEVTHPFNVNFISWLKLGYKTLGILNLDSLPRGSDLPVWSASTCVCHPGRC